MVSVSLNLLRVLFLSFSFALHTQPVILYPCTLAS